MPAIEVHNLAKRYRINHEEAGGRSFTQRCRDFVHSGMRNLRQGAALGHVEDFWALDDINFSIDDGEVVGIIGRNGAGKSTLLKILTRITQPTRGRAVIRGRVGSLLEVGTGFHPELTGRENVFLNASILGMTRQEIKAKFDEIAAFSGVEKFLDTPVKRYSSGMKVRLAFSVAAHLDLEVLLVDEVLAVGDADFQRRCLGKIHSLGTTGRTALVVSHNMPTIQALCSRAIWLKQGRIIQDDAPTGVIHAYLKEGGSLSGHSNLGDGQGRDGTGAIRFSSIHVASLPDNRDVVTMADDVKIVAGFQARESIPDCNFGIHISNSSGQVIYRMITRDTVDAPISVTRDGKIECRLRQPRFLPDTYEIYLVASANTGRILLDEVPCAARFEVQPCDVYGTGKVPDMGVLYATCEWQLK